jgi:hypothetical protein
MFKWMKENCRGPKIKWEGEERNINGVKIEEV